MNLFEYYVRWQGSQNVEPVRLSLHPHRGGAMAAPAGASVEDAVDFLRAFEARTWTVELRLSQLESSFKDLEARLNTVQLRLCSLEEDFQAYQTSQAQLVGMQGLPLQSEVSILRHLVTELTEVSNRISPEVGRLLVWRKRFTESLQAQLLLIGHQFALACPQIDLNTLD